VERGTNKLGPARHDVNSTTPSTARADLQCMRSAERTFGPGPSTKTPQGTDDPQKFVHRLIGLRPGGRAVEKSGSGAEV
jgi:hypothetical protein